MAGPLDGTDIGDRLPDVAAILDDSRLRPIGLLGGAAAVLLGATLQVSPASGAAVHFAAGLFVFAGVPLFCLGLAAAEPEGDDRFNLGVELTVAQRRVVATGVGLVLLSPVVVGLLGPSLGYPVAVWFAAGALALLGSVFILTGFIAWTSRTLGDGSPTR